MECDNILIWQVVEVFMHFPIESFKLFNISLCISFVAVLVLRVSLDKLGFNIFYLLDGLRDA